MNLQLYVLPITIDETRGVVRNIIMRLRELSGQRNLARLASRITSQDLLKSYFEHAYLSPAVLTPEEFFAPYDTGLIPLLRSKSVELFNADLTELRTDQAVIDDLVDRTEYQKQTRPAGPKSYRTNLHDMVLWHFTDRRRPKPLELPLEISSWIVTIDYTLISFDKYKNRSQSPGLPMCLHPTSLIHLFQFWVPSSMKLDTALVGSLRQPLLFLDFDIDSEQVTLRILAQLAHYINAKGVTDDVAVEILTNTALRERMASSPPDRESDEHIIREQLPQLLSDLGEKVVTLRRENEEYRSRAKELQRYKASASRERSRRRVLENDLEAEKRARSQAEGNAQCAAEDAANVIERVVVLEQRNQQYEQRLKERKEADRRRLENRQLGRRTVGTLLAVAAVVLGGRTVHNWGLPTRPGYMVTIGLVGVVMILGIKLAVKGTRWEQIRVLKWWEIKHRAEWWKPVTVVVIGELIASVVIWGMGL